MNSRQKIVQERFLDNEQAVIDSLEETYRNALNDVEKNIKGLKFQIDELREEINVFDGSEAEKEILESRLQAKIYQEQYQKTIHKQIDTVLDKMNDAQYDSVQAYLKECYDDGFIGTLYDLQPRRRSGLSRQCGDERDLPSDGDQRSDPGVPGRGRSGYRVQYDQPQLF